MSILLKKAIVDWMFENRDIFGLVNATTKRFSNYIYDDKGEYMFGGADVSDFIKQAEKLVLA